MFELILPLKKKIRSLVNGDRNNEDGEFAKRIWKRHSIFWSAPEAELIRNVRLSVYHPLPIWKYGQHWQRKLSNKYNAREFAKLHGCKVPLLFWKGRDVTKINFNRLPSNYVIRPTVGHSCNSVFLMANSVNLLDKKVYRHEEIKSVLSTALNKNRRLEFLFEEFVKSEKGHHSIPDDYKFFMFNGEIALIMVINRFGAKEGTISYYDKDWNMLPPSVRSKQYSLASYQNPPKCVNEMKAYARKLSIAYEIFVRIDFYATDKGAVFGEFTPTPALGLSFTDETDKLIISYWDRYCKGKI